MIVFLKIKRANFYESYRIGDKILLVYLKLQLKLLKSEGIFIYEHLCDTIVEEIALTLDEDVNIVKLLLSALSKTKTIEFLNEDTFMLSEMQELIGSEGSSAARVRKHRERYKLLQSNALVTCSNHFETTLLRRERSRE